MPLLPKRPFLALAAAIALTTTILIPTLSVTPAAAGTFVSFV